jgi:osmotically-inducible protein OsmY
MRKLILQSILAFGACGAFLFAQGAPEQVAAGQSAASTDSEMTSKLRQVLMNDSSIGNAAQHLRVNTKNGVVTLRGKVDSSAEKDEAMTQAKQIAGDANVKDEITVAKK